MNHRWIRVGAIVLAGLVVLACVIGLLFSPRLGSPDSRVEQDTSTGSREMPPAQPAEFTGAEGEAVGGASNQAVAQAAAEQMIIWTATAELTVADTEQAIEDIQALTRELGGYAIASESWRQDSQLYARITFRVPVDRFEQAMARLRDMAVRVDRETATSDDVTDEYVDLEARLRHLQAAEAQLTEFLEEAEDTEAVMAVYTQLSATQSEIEQVKGQMDYLETLSAMATITAELRPESAARPLVEEGWRPLATVRNAARSLLDALRGLGDAVIYFVVFLLPILLLVALPFVVLFLIIRAVRRRRSAGRAA
jgi:hypothetical protein